MQDVITTTPEQTPEQTPVREEAAAAAPRLRQLMGRYSGPQDLDGQLRLAAQLATARRALPWQWRDSPGDLLALIQHAIALDIQLMVAIDNIHFNKDGVGGMKARLMHALVLRAGHRIEVLRADGTVARMRLVRGDGRPGGSATWTLAEAQAIGLVKADKDGNNWRCYPADMLWARGISRVTRRHAPDVISGFYEVGELDDIPDDLGPVDMSTALSDVDGNLLPAPDVERLLTGLDTLGSEEIRNVWMIAREEGVLRAYGGTVEGVHHTVEEILFDAGTSAQEREEAARKLDSQRTRQPEGKPEGKPDSKPDSKPVEQAPAGTGHRLACSCNPAAVLAAGRHEQGCTR